MEDITSSLSASAMNSEGKQKKQPPPSSVSALKKNCLYFTASLQESFRYVKAFFVGQAKKITAKNEEEATAAELETAKMQVEVADAAEETKSRLKFV